MFSDFGDLPETLKIKRKQENPPAWTQEAYRPRRIKYSICCPVRGGTPSQVTPPPPVLTWPGGYPISGTPRPDLVGVYPISGIPLLSWPSWGVPHPCQGVPHLRYAPVGPGQDTSSPIGPGSGVLAPVGPGWGTPPPPSWTWLGYPPVRPGQGTPPPPLDLAGGTIPRCGQTRHLWKQHLAVASDVGTYLCNSFKQLCYFGNFQRVLLSYLQG